MKDTCAGGKVNKEYVELRAKWEPLYEVTQIKGDGETHPVLSPNDEFADYETLAKGNLDLTQLKQDDMLQREYAREALKNGLVLEEKLGWDCGSGLFSGAGREEEQGENQCEYMRRRRNQGLVTLSNHKCTSHVFLLSSVFIA